MRLDPRTKLFLLFVVNLILMMGKITGVHFWVRLAMAALPFLLLLSKKKYKPALIYLLLYSYALLGEGVFVPKVYGVASIAFMFTTGLISRTVGGGMMAYYVLSSTKISEFVTAMKRMHIPDQVTIPFTVMFRFFPTIKEEAEDITAAMKMRGIGFSFEYIIVPLLMSMSKIGDELSAACMTKCLGIGDERTYMVKVGFSVWDVLFFVIGLTGLALYLLYQ